MMERFDYGKNQQLCKDIQKVAARFGYNIECQCNTKKDKKVFGYPVSDNTQKVLARYGYNVN